MTALLRLAGGLAHSLRTAIMSVGASIAAFPSQLLSGHGGGACVVRPLNPLSHRLRCAARLMCGCPVGACGSSGRCPHCCRRRILQSRAQLGCKVCSDRQYLVQSDAPSKVVVGTITALSMIAHHCSVRSAAVQRGRRLTLHSDIQTSDVPTAASTCLVDDIDICIRSTGSSSSSNQLGNKTSPTCSWRMRLAGWAVAGEAARFCRPRRCLPGTAAG
jgi:hypothetical protein